MNEETDEKPKRRGRPPKVKAYRYTGKAKIHTSVGRFVDGDITEDLPEDERTDLWVEV